MAYSVLVACIVYGIFGMTGKPRQHGGRIPQVLPPLLFKLAIDYNHA
jgi:hypothetical protein